jgi:hypothetical protein
MKHLLFLILLCSTSAMAQVTTPLPYTTGFDNTAQQAGWQQFREGYASAFSWSFNPYNYASGPYCLFHDYPVGESGADTTIDWYVSPAFDFHTGATVSLKINMFAMVGFSPADECKLFLLSGSANPATATKTELASFASLATFSQSYADTSIVIPPATGISYLAFKYQATNNWVTPSIDDISIVANPDAVSTVKPKSGAFSIYPIPATNQLNLKYGGVEVDRLWITDISGKTVKGFAAKDRSLDVSDLPSGMYFLHIGCGTSSSLRTLVFTKR